MYPECFSGIGTFKNYRYYIELDPNIKPAVHPSKKDSFILAAKVGERTRLDGETRHHSSSG